MYLKQLDMIGFKSFARRTRLDFVPGVTAVVGPNGSGKSNISDAIRWVLGEQSVKSLRGSKMEELIFSGSDARKPLNVAEVTLTLDNEDQYLAIDFSEVSMTRRVYRSGESEFLLNKQPCRLKDIVDLFMDSGLGQEAYSVIGQGKIDEILNSKSEDKRKIFEEAAGVLKYKTRKWKSERKLEETEDNLHRVNDILYELKTQVEPLKIQASIAKDYLEKKEELKRIEVAFLVHEIEASHQKWTTLSENIKTLKNKELELSVTVSKEDAAIGEKRSELQKMDQSIDQLQEELLVASESLEKLEGQREVLKERKKNTMQNHKRLNERIKELEEKISQSDTDLQEQQKRFTASQNQLTELQKQLKDKTSQFEMSEHDVAEMLEGLKSDYIEILNEQATVRNEIRYLQKQSEQLRVKKGRIRQDKEKYEAKQNGIKSQKNKISQMQEKIQQQLDDVKISYKKLEKQLQAEIEVLRAKEQQLERAKQNWQHIQSRREILEAMQEDYSGFFYGVRAILKAKLPGIRGAVAELIDVPKTYEIAIETALGSGMQHVVVEREEHAREAISHLKKTGGGRATFLPISNIKPRRLPAGDLDIVGKASSFVGVASDLISAPRHYQHVLDHLLGTVIITETLKSANEIAQLLHYRYRVVTLDGDVVNPGGSMAGGSKKKQKHSLLGRQRELEEATQQFEKIEDQLVQLEKDVRGLQQGIDRKKSELASLAEKGEILRQTEQKQNMEKHEMETEEKTVKERLTFYIQENQEIDEDMAPLMNRLHKLEASLQEMAQSKGRLDEKIAEVTERKQNQDESKEHMQSVMTELKVQVAQQEQHVLHLKEALEKLTHEKEEDEKQLHHSQQAFQQSVEDMDEHTSVEEKMDEQMTAKRKDKDTIMEQISYCRKERINMQNLIEDKERELKEVKRAEKQHGDWLRAEEVKQSRLDVALDNRLQVLQEDYELSFEAAKAKYSLSIEMDEARKKIKLVKLAIDDLGTVNLGAIDEYERVSDRIQFLIIQKEDLETARQDLLDVIEEMDGEVMQRFEKTFSKVREQFQIIFKQLFGGGHADLWLSNPDHLLDTGIEIMVQPPGKKLQHLSLLSGGERALTAITLLFAMLKVRPVPFCVLDEVEAALDDANVSRFAKYLKTFSHETQFIIATHRKGTMEEADVLYGVTMQESGISNLVSVRLEESKPLVET